MLFLIPGLDAHASFENDSHHMLSVSTSDWSGGRLSMDVAAHGSTDRIELPASIQFVPFAEAEALRDLELSIRGAVRSDRQDDRWIVAAGDGVTFAARRPIVRTDSLAAVVGAHTLTGGRHGTQHGIDVSSWFGNGAADLLVAARLTHSGGEMGRSVMASYNRTATTALTTTAELAHTSSGTGSWLRISEGVNYRFTRAVELHALFTHDGPIDSLASSVDLTVVVNFGAQTR